RSWVIDRRAEIAGGPFSVLDRNLVVTAVPFQTLMSDPEGVSIRGRNNSPGRCRPALRSGEIEPHTKFPARRFHIIETHIDVVLGVVSMIGNDVGPCAGNESNRHFADLDVQVFNSGAVSAHVKKIEIVNLYVLAPVVALAGPEPRSRLALEDVAGLNEGFAQPELVITDAVGKTGKVGGVRSVGLDHKLGLHP